MTKVESIDLVPLGPPFNPDQNATGSDADRRSSLRG